MNLADFVTLFIELLAIFKDNSVIGTICALMILSAVAVIIRILTLNLHKNFCIQTMTKPLSAQHINSSDALERALTSVDDTVESYDYSEIKLAWREYRPSVKLDPIRGTYHSPIDPYSILNVDTLGLSFRNWERIATLFVSVGLVLTFMGLVASLQQSGTAILSAGSEGGDIKDALSDLLIIVSSKFILSITGLACSIAINLVIDHRMRMNRRDIARLNFALRSKIQLLPSEIVLSDIRDTLIEHLNLARGTA